MATASGKKNNSLTTLLNAAMVIGTLLITYLLLEIGLRLAGYNPFGEFFTHDGRAIFIRPSLNAQRVYEATPNARGHGWETFITINSHGFRGREYTLTKPPGTFRIIVIGDSITFGNRLPQDQNYPALLEARYLAAEQSVEVLNLGLGGYDTLQEVATLKDIGLQFEPDLVIVGYCINDIGVASGNANYIKRLQKYGNPVYRSRLAQWLRVQLDRVELIQASEQANQAESFSHAYQHQLADIQGDQQLNNRVHALRAALHTEKNPPPFTADYTDETRLRRLRFAFEQLHQLQQQNQPHPFPVMIVTFPYLLQNKNNAEIFQRIQAILAHESERLNFEILDLYSLFAEEGIEKLMIDPADGIHPNAYAHQLLAEKLFNTLTLNSTHSNIVDANQKN